MRVIILPLWSAALAAALAVPLPAVAGDGGYRSGYAHDDRPERHDRQGDDHKDHEDHEDHDDEDDDGGEGDDDDAHGDGGRGDHDRARRAREAGQILPLRDILARVEALHPGTLIEAELNRKHGRMVYEIEVLTADGGLVKLLCDAGTGAILQARGRAGPR